MQWALNSSCPRIFSFNKNREPLGNEEPEVKRIKASLPSLVLELVGMQVINPVSLAWGGDAFQTPKLSPDSQKLQRDRERL